MSLTSTDKKEIETLIRKEIREFLGSNTIKQYEEKLMKEIQKEIKYGKMTPEIKEIVVRMFREFYHFMWNQRGYWEPRLKNS